MALLEATDLKKTYRRGEQTVEALRGVSLRVNRGELVSIMGPSGSGKSTLLHLIGGLDRPTAGSVLLDGQALESYSDGALSRFRRTRLGFVFQFFNLLPNLTALENVALPLLLDGASIGKVAPKARELLAQVGLEQRVDHRPAQLSGGEMQRVAIARALIGDPLLVLADEPTGNLDSKAGAAVLELLQKTVRERGQTLIMVTHDPKAAAYGTQQIRVQDGLIAADEPRR
ncbi:MAG: ABC transporter ATP-binding protein [Myxococcales bacterium]